MPCAKVASLDEVPDLVEATSPGYLVREVHPRARRDAPPRPAVTFDEDVVIRPAPAIGEHTAEILAELDGA